MTSSTLEEALAEHALVEQALVEAALSKAAAPIEAALAERLGAVIPHLVAPKRTPPGGGSQVARADGERHLGGGVLVDTVAQAICARPTPDRLWLALSAVAGCLPSADDVGEARYRAETSSPAHVAIWMLDYASERMTSATDNCALRVVTDLVLVEFALREQDRALLDITLLSSSTLSLWQSRGGVLPVTWAPGYECWTAMPKPATPTSSGSSELALSTPTQMVVPWHTTVVILGAADPDSFERMAAAAEFSGSTFAALADDCFPAASAGLLADNAVAHTSKYLSVLKHFKRLATTSETSAADYRGFISAMPAQGLAGPDISLCALPTTPRRTCIPSRPKPPTLEPMVLCVGDVDDRSNQLGFLYASEILWREGLRFKVTLVGGEAHSDDTLEFFDGLVAAGRPAYVQLGASKSAVDSLYGCARFAVFASGHEGSTVAISQSLSRRVPVVCSHYVVASGGHASAGIATFDPADDASLALAMRTLLIDDAAIGKLHAEIDGREPRSWDDYAADLWAMLVDHAKGPDGLDAPDGPKATA